jgi:hypothetical protein
MVLFIFFIFWFLLHLHYFTALLPSNCNSATAHFQVIYWFTCDLCVTPVICRRQESLQYLLQKILVSDWIIIPVHAQNDCFPKLNSCCLKLYIFSSIFLRYKVWAYYLLPVHELFVCFMPWNRSVYIELKKLYTNLDLQSVSVYVDIWLRFITYTTLQQFY